MNKKKSLLITKACFEIPIFQEFLIFIDWLLFNVNTRWMSLQIIIHVGKKSSSEMG